MYFPKVRRRNRGWVLEGRWMRAALVCRATFVLNFQVDFQLSTTSALAVVLHQYFAPH